MAISTQVIDVLDYLCEKFGVAIDWSQETIVPYIQELSERYISWEMSTSIAWIIIAVLLFLIPSIIAITLDIKYRISGGVLVAIGMFGIIISCVVIGCQIFDILRCVYFPELQVLKYIESLLSSQSG